MTQNSKFEFEMYKYFAMQYFDTCGDGDIEYLVELIKNFELEDSDVLDNIVEHKEDLNYMNVNVAIEIVWETAISKALEELELEDFNYLDYLEEAGCINFFPNSIASNFYIGQEVVYDYEQLKKELLKFVLQKGFGYNDINSYENISLETLKNIPTIEQGFNDDLKISNENYRVWLSRMTIEDEMKYNNCVTVEYFDENNSSWKVLFEYEAV